MPYYKVQLKQGQRTIVEHIEAKDTSSILAFFEEISTMKVSEILRIEYQMPESSTIPIDDFLYTKLYKSFIKNTDTNISRQIVVHNIKKSKNEKDVANAIRTFLEVGGLRIDSVFTSLMKA